MDKFRASAARSYGSADQVPALRRSCKNGSWTMVFRRAATGEPSLIRSTESLVSLWVCIRHLVHVPLLNLRLIIWTEGIACRSVSLTDLAHQQRLHRRFKRNGAVRLACALSAESLSMVALSLRPRMASFTETASAAATAISCLVLNLTPALMRVVALLARVKLDARKWLLGIARGVVFRFVAVPFTRMGAH